MPILFACQKIQKAPAGSRRIIGVGAFFEVLYITYEHNVLQRFDELHVGVG